MFTSYQRWQRFQTNWRKKKVSQKMKSEIVWVFLLDDALRVFGKIVWTHDKFLKAKLWWLLTWWKLANLHKRERAFPFWREPLATGIRWVECTHPQSRGQEWSWRRGWRFHSCTDTQLPGYYLSTYSQGLNVTTKQYFRWSFSHVLCLFKKNSATLKTQGPFWTKNSRCWSQL